MRLIKTHKLDQYKLTPLQTLQVYNGLDCCVTTEVSNVLYPQLSGPTRQIYEFEKGLSGPALEMMLGGILIDSETLSYQLCNLKGSLAQATARLNDLAIKTWNRLLNPNSVPQLKEFFYGYLRLPEIVKYAKGKKTVSMDRDAIERLRILYTSAEPFCDLILQIKDLRGKIKVLESGVDRDCRIRTSYNICGTSTGRWSSSKNAFGTGTNLQNWEDSLRQMLTADPGYKFAYIDLDQAESRVVGLIVASQFRDEAYLDAALSGYLHTEVCKMVWPGLPWTDDPDVNKSEVAETKFYRHHSYRDMAKRAGHGSNYFGKPYTLGREMKVETRIMEDFQLAYFGGYPGIPRWHQSVAEKLQTTGSITTMLGRYRKFHARAWDDATLRKAIAYEPQSVIADALNTALWLVWAHHRSLCRVVLQLHDAIGIIYKQEHEPSVIPIISKTMEIPLQAGDYRIVLTNEVKTGWNFAKFSDKNPDGLKTWKGYDGRIRTKEPRVSLLY